MGRVNFSGSEIEYLENNWGLKSVSTIAKNLNRSISSIVVKKNRMKLGAFLDNGAYITVNQLFKAIGREGGTGYVLYNWIKKGLPVKNKKVLNNSFKIIYLDDFWKWAKEYRMHIDFNKFKENALGFEPDWVKEQRKADIAFSKYKVTPWTKKEDSQLESLLKLFKYTYRELSLQVLRAEGGIKKRINNLGLSIWPLREPPNSKWTDEEINVVVSMYGKGYRSEVIKEYIDKSSQAISGKIERLIRDGVIIKHK